jgi:hypothetical protein
MVTQKTEKFRLRLVHEPTWAAGGKPIEDRRGRRNIVHQLAPFFQCISQEPLVARCHVLDPGTPGVHIVVEGRKFPRIENPAMHPIFVGPSKTGLTQTKEEASEGYVAPKNEAVSKPPTPHYCGLLDMRRSCDKNRPRRNTNGGFIFHCEGG